MHYGKGLLTTILLGCLSAAATADEAWARPAASAESRAQARERSSGSSGQVRIATEERAGVDTEASLGPEIASSTAAAVKAEIARDVSSTLEAAIQQEIRMSVQAEITGLVSCGLGR